jgi:hypothetical protein
MLLGKICISVTLAAMLVAAGAGAATAGTSDIPPGARQTTAPAPAARVHPDTNPYTCTPGGSFSLCVGVNYSGTYYIENVQIQAQLPYYEGDITYSLTGPGGFSASGGPYTGGPGWAPQLTVPVNRFLPPGEYCGSVATDGNVIAFTCVYAPLEA